MKAMGHSTSNMLQERSPEAVTTRGWPGTHAKSKIALLWTVIWRCFPWAVADRKGRKMKHKIKITPFLGTRQIQKGCIITEGHGCVQKQHGSVIRRNPQQISVCYKKDRAEEKIKHEMELPRSRFRLWFKSALTNSPFFCAGLFLSCIIYGHQQ